MTAIQRAKAEKHHKQMMIHLTDALGEAIELLKAMDEDPTAVNLLGSICSETNTLLTQLLENKRSKA